MVELTDQFKRLLVVRGFGAGVAATTFLGLVFSLVGLLPPVWFWALACVLSWALAIMTKKRFEALGGK